MSFKILFMGTPDFAVPILKSIHKSKNKILEIYTQPPKKKNRGQKIQNSPIHICADQLNLNVRYPATLETKEELSHIKNLKPDVVIVVAYGKILPASLLNLDNIIFINVHASLLPRWRGAAPIQRAIMNKDEETGISIMKIIEKLDAGPVMLKSKINLTPESNFQDISKQMSDIGAKLILDALHLIKTKKANFVNQDEEQATYAKKIKKDEAKINWNENASTILAKINALSPNPGCWFNLQGARIKILKAKKVQISGNPGSIVDENFTIACYKNALQILELKKEGKNKTSAQEFLRGNRLHKGFNLL
jgi:methionyl-tRNA formyltransferase